MRGVAGDEDAVGAVAVGDQLAAHPAHDRQDFVVEVAAHRALQRRADVVFGVVDLLRRADDRHAEAVGAVDRDDGEPDALRADEDEAIALALVVQLGKVRAAEHHIGGVGQRRRAAHADAELLAHGAGAAVGADHVVGFDGFGLAGRRCRAPRRARRPAFPETRRARSCSAASRAGTARRSAAGSDRTCPAARARASAGSPAGRARSRGRETARGRARSRSVR